MGAFKYSGDQLRNLATIAVPIDAEVLQLCRDVGILKRKRCVHRGRRRATPMQPVTAFDNALATATSVAGNVSTEEAVSIPVPATNIGCISMSTRRTPPVAVGNEVTNATSSAAEAAKLRSSEDNQTGQRLDVGGAENDDDEIPAPTRPAGSVTEAVGTGAASAGGANNISAPSAVRADRAMPIPAPVFIPAPETTVSPSKISLTHTNTCPSSSPVVSDNGTKSRPTVNQTCRNPAVIKQRASYLFQTVNHAKVIWDPKLKPRGLFGGHLNARSVVSKSDQLIHLLSSSNLDFLCVSETWLQQSTPVSVFSIPGYQCFRQDRLGGRGGGVMIYVKDAIKCERIKLDTADDVECVAITVVLSQQMSFILIAFYRPPSANDSFYSTLANMLKQCKQQKEVILMGDFNLNWEDKGKRKKLKAITDKYNLQQVIKGPTRVTKRSSTMLDLIFTNKPERVTKTYNLLTALSDHNLTLVARKLTKNRFQNTTHHTEIISRIPKAKQLAYESEINGINWEDVLSSEDLDHGCDLFADKLNSTREKFTVQSKRRQKKRVNLPWFSDTLWQLMKQRDSALKKANKTKRDSDILIYKGLRNKVVNEIRLAKSSFYIQVLNENKGNSKEIWKIINNLTGRGGHQVADIQLKYQNDLIKDNDSIAGILNTYFIESVYELGNHFMKNDTMPVVSLHTENDTGFSLNIIDEAHIKKIIDSLTSSKSRDAFHMDSMLIKKHLNTLTRPITHLINLSITQSCFPNNWKRAVITPIFKSGDPLEPNNYRPISILPVLSKITEKVVIDQLTKHLDTCNPGLNNMQFGFRKNYSTETAVLYFTEKIRLLLEKGGVVGAVFLDLRKAFDTVNHNILISKLSHFNLSTQTLTWLSTYLSNRVQCVRVKDAYSTYVTNTMGVPQGSVLGPLLFSLYINDLPQHCNGVDIQLYADDTVLYAHAKNSEMAAEKLTNAMQGVAQWLEQSCLTLNISKTKGMFFYKRKGQIPSANIKIRHESIDIVTEFKYLGVTLDTNLNFKKHVKNMTKTIKYNLANFRHIRSSLPMDVAKTFLHGLIFSHISYCITCWGQANESTIRPLKSQYKQALKILDKKPLHYHHCNILEKHHLLSFENFREFSSLCLVYKILHGLAPACLLEFVCHRPARSIRSSRIASASDCRIPHYRSTFGQSSFSFKATSLWNVLPAELRNCVSFSHFKPQLKYYLKNSQHCIH